MISDERIERELHGTLDETHFEHLGLPHKGKVRDSYTAGDVRTVVTTDRVSAFDRLLGTMPFKGQALNEIANFWFEATSDIIPNHLLEVPDPSFHGHSIGRWEGNTLVVDTVHILPQAPLAISEAVGVPNNGDMHVTERIYLADKDILHVDLEITAPHILTKPWKTTRIFFRQRARKFDIVEGVCASGDLAERVSAEGDHIFVPVEKSEWGHTTAVPAK